MNRKMLAMCSFPFCKGSAAVLMQPTFDRGRADSAHDGSAVEARWTGCAYRHDLDGRDHDHGWRAPCNEGTGPARTREDFPQHISIQQPLKQAMQFIAESVCRDNAVLDLRLSTTKRLMGSACLRRGGKTRASQRKLGATSTSTSHSSMRRRWNMKSQLRVRQASTKAMNCFQARCRIEGAPASCR